MHTVLKKYLYFSEQIYSRISQVDKHDVRKIRLTLFTIGPFCTAQSQDMNFHAKSYLCVIVYYATQTDEVTMNRSYCPGYRIFFLFVVLLAFGKGKQDLLLNKTIHTLRNIQSSIRLNWYII